MPYFQYFAASLCAAELRCFSTLLRLLNCRFSWVSPLFSCISSQFSTGFAAPVDLPDAPFPARLRNPCELISQIEADELRVVYRRGRLASCDAIQRATSTQEESEQDRGQRTEHYDIRDPEQQLARLRCLRFRGLRHRDQIAAVVHTLEQPMALVWNRVAADDGDHGPRSPHFERCLV